MLSVLGECMITDYHQWHDELENAKLNQCASHRKWLMLRLHSAFGDNFPWIHYLLLHILYVVIHISYQYHQICIDWIQYVYVKICDKLYWRLPIPPVNTMGTNNQLKIKYRFYLFCFWNLGYRCSLFRVSISKSMYVRVCVCAVCTCMRVTHMMLLLLMMIICIFYFICLLARLFFSLSVFWHWFTIICGLLFYNHCIETINVPSKSMR